MVMTHPPSRNPLVALQMECNRESPKLEIECLLPHLSIQTCLSTFFQNGPGFHHSLCSRSLLCTQLASVSMEETPPAKSGGLLLMHSHISRAPRDAGISRCESTSQTPKQLNAERPFLVNNLWVSVSVDLKKKFHLKHLCFFPFHVYLQGKTPQERAQQAGDPELAAYLESRQNYKIIGHEDLETTVWPWETSKENLNKHITCALPAIGQLPWKKLMESINPSLSCKSLSETTPPVFKGYQDVQQNRIAHKGRGRVPGDLWNMSSTIFDPYRFQQVAWTSVSTCIIYFKDSKDVRIKGTAPFSPMHSPSPTPHHFPVPTHPLKKCDMISSL